MWDRAYGNNLYVLFFSFLKKCLKNYWHFVTGSATLIDVDADGAGGVIAWMDEDNTTLMISSQITRKNNRNRFFKPWYQQYDRDDVHVLFM